MNQIGDRRHACLVAIIKTHTKNGILYKTRIGKLFLRTRILPEVGGRVRGATQIIRCCRGGGTHCIISLKDSLWLYLLPNHIKTLFLKNLN